MPRPQSRPYLPGTNAPCVLASGTSIAPRRRALFRQTLLVLLDLEQVVSVEIAEEEHPRYRPFAPHRLLDVDALLAQRRVVGFEIVRGEHDARLDVSRRLARAWRHQRDRRARAGGRDLEPAVAVPERDVGALLEAERLDVELECPVLVGHRDDHASHLRDVCGGLLHGCSFRRVRWLLTA